MMRKPVRAIRLPDGLLSRQVSQTKEGHFRIGDCSMICQWPDHGGSLMRGHFDHVKPCNNLEEYAAAKSAVQLSEIARGVPQGEATDD